MSSDGDNWTRAWESTLAEMEIAVDEAEAMLRSDHLLQSDAPAPWTPPVGLGPIPASLVDRARAVLARQLDVSAQLSAATTVNRRHDRALSQMHQGSPTAPVYLDMPA